MNKRKLQIQQIDKRISSFTEAKRYPTPSSGWIRAIRMALGMTLQQLANKLSITKQGVKEMELREAEGAITLKSLREAAKAMDMELVYGFVPIAGTLEKHIEKKSSELAKQIVLRTSNNMKLEDQENSNDRIKKAIQERTAILKHEIPKTLWD